MQNPIHTLGYRLLQQTVEHENSDSNVLPQLTRRGFLLTAAALTSCSAAPPAKPEPTAPGMAAQPTPPQPVKTTANTNYSTPNVGKAPLRNPNINASSNFSSNIGTTFSRVPVNGKYIAMTFDDGPHPQNTTRLLDILRARNIKATFYVIGRSVDLYPHVLRRTVAEGHEIGNHSHTHRLLSKLSNDEVRTELSRCRDACQRAAGIQPRTLRPPYGGLLQNQREMVLNEFSYPTILWSVDPLDWKRPGPSVVTSRILRATTPGGIVLSHDLHAPTVDAMPATLDGLLERGFQFVTVSQLLAMRAEPTTAQVSASS